MRVSDKLRVMVGVRLLVNVRLGEQLAPRTLRRPGKKIARAGVHIIFGVALFGMSLQES